MRPDSHSRFDRYAATGLFSFVSQRVYGIERGSPHGRVIAENHANETGEYYRYNDGDR